MGGRSRVLGVLAASLAVFVLCPASGSVPVGLAGASPAGRTQGAAGCETERSPYADVAGSNLTAEVHTSKDEEPVTYVRWSGFVSSFDGLPLSVAVTVPCDVPDGALPTIAMLHGFTDDKTIWEETGKSDTVESADRPGANSRWNNIWFASRGYVTLTYTARGWRDSCGPDTPGGTAGAPPPQCADHQYWIHLDDKRWEVRDAQWLTAGLVQSGVADPDRLAITGGSYGGAPTASAALLADQVMCGADPVPGELGEDPCTDAGNGDLVPWTTADGATTLSWAAALPLYTFSDLLRVLAPNGRWSDGTTTVPPGGSSTSPFGVPLESTVSGLVLAAQAFGSLAPEGADPDSDILTTTSRLLAGDPYDPEDPVVAQGIEVYERFKSPITTDVGGDVPIFWVQGSTDALFPASEALAMVDHLHAADAEYPVKVFLGDIGHDYAAERQDDWDLVKGQMNDFVDHYLRPDRTPDAPVFDVGASVSRCFDPQAEQTYVTAPSWAELADDRLTLSAFDGGTTSTAEQGPSGVATDPVSTATLPGEDSYKGCRIMRPAETDPTTVTFELAVDEEVLLMGAPLVDLEVVATGPDAPIAVRVWDVNEDRSAKALVTRGVYRMEAPAQEGTQVRFLLTPQAYRFEAGHLIQVEVTGNDTPYLLANNQPSDLTIESLELTLPRRTAAADDDEAAPLGGVAVNDDVEPLVVVATGLGIVLLIGLLGTALWRWRRRRQQPADVP